MGLLDALNSDEGQMALGLLAAAGPSATPMSFGQRLYGAMQQDQARRSEAEDRKMRQQMQMRALLEGEAARKKAAEQEQSRLGYLGAIDSSQGPPMQFSMPRALAAGLSLPEIGALMPQQAKGPEFKVVGGRLVRIQGDDVREAYAAPEKPNLNDLIIPGPDGQPILNKALFDAKRQIAASGAANVSQINSGQKGLDNTLKLRGDFRSEPVYKAHQEMQSAYSQIQQSLKQESPAGDLAGATKIMKLLDPGSVVRESELGMAMQASGLMDRVQNYATNIIKGTKLTPTQRADFQRLADALYGESVKQYNVKRQEYQGIAERNGLNVPDVLGAPSAAPTGKVVNFGDLK